MTPPAMARWNPALRFALELAALAGLGAVAWRLGPKAAHGCSMMGRKLGLTLGQVVEAGAEIPDRDGSTL